MAFGKWIGGYLGWSAFGPLGGILGFVIGALLDTATTQGGDETLRLSDEQSQQGDRNSFFISMFSITCFKLPYTHLDLLFLYQNGQQSSICHYLIQNENIHSV